MNNNTNTDASGTIVFQNDAVTAAVSDDFECAARARYELRRNADFVFNLGRQTGGPRQVVSTHAVFDRDLHVVLLPLGSRGEGAQPSLAL